MLGDIVKIEKGFKIAADMVVLDSNGIKVDNSSLTGESEPQKRGPVMTDDLPFRTRSAFGCAMLPSPFSRVPNFNRSNIVVSSDAGSRAQPPKSRRRSFIRRKRWSGSVGEASKSKRA